MGKEENEITETFQGLFGKLDLENMRPLFEGLLNRVMLLERAQFLNAHRYERTGKRRGYRNGSKAKTLKTRYGKLNLRVPKTSEHAIPFYPSVIERGERSERALYLLMTSMYIKGVATRKVVEILRIFGLENVQPSEVSRMSKKLDEQIKLWRERKLGTYAYLMVDARYNKVRFNGVMRDGVVMVVAGIDKKSGLRSVLGVQTSLSEAEVLWRAFFQSLVDRGLNGVEYVVADNHAGLRQAARRVFPGTLQQRCQFHLSQNALNYVPNLDVKKKIGVELRDQVWNAGTLQQAEQGLQNLVTKYANSAPKLADWLEENVAEGFIVYKLPPELRVRLRTTNIMERAINQEIKRRTRQIRVFPTEASLLFLVSAILVEIDEKWATEKRPYLSGSEKEAKAPTKQLPIEKAKQLEEKVGLVSVGTKQKN